MATTKKPAAKKSKAAPKKTAPPAAPAKKKPVKKTEAPVAAPAPAAAADGARRDVVSVKFDIVLNSKNGLRRVKFTLERNTAGTRVNWKIHFELFERASKNNDYADPLITLTVSVATNLNEAAQKIATRGMSTSQSAHAVGPAAEDAVAVKAGEIPESEAKATIEETLRL